MSYFAAGAEASYQPDYATTAGDTPAPLLSDVPYGPAYEPVSMFWDQYKWWVVGGGVGLFLLAGGSILGLSLRKKHRRRR